MKQWGVLTKDEIGRSKTCHAFFLEEENLGHSIQGNFSNFGHSFEFRVFSLENIEHLVVNLRPGSVY